MSAASVVRMPTRRAQARDVKGADLSRWAVIVYKDLVTHCNADNACWPKRETQAGDLRVSTRTITKARNELLEKGWICYPEGDSGGRAFAKEDHDELRGRGVRIHLHPDGCPCGLPKVELKQHAAARTANEKRSEKRAAQGSAKDEIRSSLDTPVKDEICTVKDEIRDRAYKEGTLSIGTLSTTTASEQPENSGPMLVAAKPSQEINYGAKSAATGYTPYTSTMRPRFPEVSFASEEEKDWVLAAWRLHPKKQGDKYEAFEYLQSVYRDPEKKRVFDVNHPRWCQTQQWRKENYRYCPRIPAFIESEQYLDPPTEGDDAANDGYYEVPEL
jgi:hypothetical protein